MQKFIIAVFLVFMIFGCADDKNSLDNNSTGNNNPSNQGEYFKAIINTLSNIPVSDNVSQWGFEPDDETDNLHVFLADKLGRPNKNTNKIVYILGYSDYSHNEYSYTIYDNNSDLIKPLHRMKFYLPYTYNSSDMEHAIIDYYIKFIKTEPHKTIYEETIYIKKN